MQLRTENYLPIDPTFVLIKINMLPTDDLDLLIYTEIFWPLYVKERPISYLYKRYTYKKQENTQIIKSQTCNACYDILECPSLTILSFTVHCCNFSSFGCDT